MKKAPRYKPVRFEKFRIVMGIIALLMIIPQIVTIITLVSYNAYYDRALAFTEIAPEKLDKLYVGERVMCRCDTTTIVGVARTYDHLSERDVLYAGIVTPNEQLLILRMDDRKAPSIGADAIVFYDERPDIPFCFSGTVKKTESLTDLPAAEILSTETASRYNITGKKILAGYIDCDEPDGKYAEYVIIVDIISIPVLIAIGLFLLMPTINNLRYLSAVKKGKVVPHKAVKRRDVLNFYGGGYIDPEERNEENFNEEQPFLGSDHTNESAYDVFRPYEGYDDDSGENK